MGCKFSIQVDQPRNKTPRALNRKRSSGVQTKEDEPDEPDEPDKENLSRKDEEDPEEDSPDRETTSSPDQVMVKTLSKEYRQTWR
jgi:hypothetical protein